MKFVKYACLTLITAVVLDMALVFAYDAPAGVGLSFTLSGNTAQYSSTKTKTDYSYQKYENIGSHTAISSPCTSCQIASTMYMNGSATGGTIITVAGQIKKFDGNSASPDDYKVKVKRYDATLLSTSHTSFWTIRS